MQVDSGEGTEGDDGLDDGNPHAQAMALKEKARAYVRKEEEGSCHRLKSTQALSTVRSSSTNHDITAIPRKLRLTPLPPSHFEACCRLTSPRSHTPQLEETRGELDLANQLFHDVALHCSALKREVNAAKDVLVR